MRVSMYSGIALGALFAASCIQAPAIVMVDRATVLEQQASGSFKDLEEKLLHAGTQPLAAALTPEQLHALGIEAPSLVNDVDLTEADQVDELLKQHCLGEGLDGMLVETFDACLGTTDQAAATTLMSRTNNARMQLWRWMRTQRPDKSLEELRRAWVGAHKDGVPCGGWMEAADKRWEAKKC